MLVIGVAGGVASGKSLVTQCLEFFGADVLDADRLGHEVLRQPEVIKQIVSRWGEGILVAGAVDRQQLARIVFAVGPEAKLELQALEQITHPRIGDLIESRLFELRQSDVPAVVLDAPVMFKSGWDSLCDKILFVDVPLEMRRLRASQRGWASDELSKREANQTPLAEKRERSTDVIDNSGSKRETFDALQTLWVSWDLELPECLDPPSTLIPN